jgi:CRP-like cAMP-binding protein
MTATDLLAKAELFQDLSQDALGFVAGLAVNRKFEEGDAVYALGDDADNLFLLCQGRVRFSLGVANRPGGAGSIIMPTAVFGWAALLDEQPRRVATAVCLEDSELYVIPGAALLQFFERDQTSGYQVMRRLATMIARDFMSVLSV